MKKWKCAGCRKQFSVKVGTIFEDSPLSLDKWLIAIWMVGNCRNGVSSYEIARVLGITQKSSWFMLHRIRLIMQDDWAGGKLSGEVEVDETFIGGKARNMHLGNLTDFLFGARSHYELNNVAEVNYKRYWHMGYIQDDWKPIPKLTINAGVRYEFVSPNYEENNHILNYDPVGNRILHAGDGTNVTSTAYNLHFVGSGSLAQRSLANPDYKDLGNLCIGSASAV